LIVCVVDRGIRKKIKDFLGTCKRDSVGIKKRLEGIRKFFIGYSQYLWISLKTKKGANNYKFDQG